MIRFLHGLILLLIFGCSSQEKASAPVIFAGEIVNPTSSSVVLFKGDKLIDSAKLDKNNRFYFKFDTITEGLYHFDHLPERQYVYIEENDSLMIRLNTIDFDESLAFSGRGAEINNFLLELFLANEEEFNHIVSWYELEANDFLEKINQLEEAKYAILQDLIDEGSLSTTQRELAEASVRYSYNTYKEQYPFRHGKYTFHGVHEKLPENFYKYREKVDYGNNYLTYLRPYYNFMINHIQNLSFMGCSSECQIKNSKAQNQLHFNEHKLALIDSIVTGKELKDNLFRHVAFNYLLKVQDVSENNQHFITKFHEFSKNNRHSNEIDELYEGIENIQPKKVIPEVYVSSTTGEKVSLREIAKKGKTVFYFWSGVDKRHFENIKERVKHLTGEKPDYRYVGINMKTSEANWKGMLKNSGLDVDLQFRANDFNALTKSLIIYPENKCVITEDTLIVDAFSNLYASSFQ